jgi:hypothetical protein
MFRAFVIALGFVCACRPATAPEAAATAPEPSANAAADSTPNAARPGQGSTPDQTPEAASSNPPNDALVPATHKDPKDAALLLGHGVRNRLAGGDLAAWLEGRAAFPFDLDGKDVAASAEELTAKLPTYTSTWAEQTQTQTRCEAVSREEILAGAPLHYLDRLGGRPPAAELRRDLDRFGLDTGELFVNCYTPDATDAGYTLIVKNTPDGARLEAFRN